MNKLGFRGLVSAAMIIAVASVQTGRAQQQGGNPVLTGQPEPPPAVLTPAPRANPQGAAGARGPGARPVRPSLCRSRRLRASNLCRSIFSRRRTFTRTKTCGWTRATIAAIRRGRWSSPCGRADGSGRIRRDRLPGAIVESTIRAGGLLVPILIRRRRSSRHQALMAQAKAHGGPTVYSKATTPGLGWLLYSRSEWYGLAPASPGLTEEPSGPWEGASAGNLAGLIKIPTLLSLLTPSIRSATCRCFTTRPSTILSNGTLPSAYRKAFALVVRGLECRCNFELSITLRKRVEFLLRHRRQLSARGTDR